MRPDSLEGSPAPRMGSEGPFAIRVPPLRAARAVYGYSNTPARVIIHIFPRPFKGAIEAFKGL